jgi:sugar lactone lactonase YvrE
MFSLVILACTALAGCSSGTSAHMTPTLAGPNASASSGPGQNLYVANLDTVTVYESGSNSILRTLSHLSPSALAFASSGKLYVASIPVGGIGNVKVYRNGMPPFLRKITAGIDEPRVLGVDATGNLYVGNSYFKVQVYAPGQDSPLRYLKVFYPAAIIFDQAGNCYAASDPSPYGGRGGSKILVYSSDGKWLRTIRTGLHGPIALAFSGSGNLFVANYNGNDVTVYAPGKSRVYRKISKGIDGPVGIRFDSSGDLYVANTLASDVTVYAPGKSTVLRTIRNGISHPTAILFDASGNLYVANAKNVTAYGPGEGSPKLTITDGIRSPIALGLGP